MRAIRVLLLFIYALQMMNSQKRQTFYRCGINEKKIIPIPAEHVIHMDKDYRRLNNEEFKDFHIYLDLINIKNDIKKFKLEQYENLFINSLNKAVKILETLLKVKYREYGFKFTDKNILNMEIEDWNKTLIGSNSIGDSKQLGIDLFIFGKFDDDMEESTLASAGPFYIDPSTNQPIVGIVYINTNVNYSKIHSEEYFQSIIIHEFTHILGFTNWYFDDIMHCLFNKTDEYGLNRYYINSPKLLEVAKKYYNCSEIDGIELEESGGSGTAGSHWEARILLGDYMNGVIYPEEQVISEFTLALLEDTGYYKANYYTGGLMRYGKNKGCDFIKKRCVNSSHEINPNYENEFYDSIASPYLIDASCSSGRQSRTYYAWWLYSSLPYFYRYFSDSRYGGFAPADYCPVAREFREETINSYYTGHCSSKGNGGYGTQITYRDSRRKENTTHSWREYYYYYYRSETLQSITGETYSDHSFCYQSTLIKNELYNNNYNDLNVTRAICYESFCSNSSLTIKINEDYIVCPRAGGKVEVDGYEGYFLCPDYNLICSGTIMCNDMFDCVEKKSQVKNESYIYDYEIETSQNIERMETTTANNETNYELSENGICPINCKHCLENNRCLKCRNDYGLCGSKENEEVICSPMTELNIGYYRNNNIYYKCIENCDICSNDISCNSCSNGFDYFNGKCVIDNKTCLEFDKENICKKCMDNYAFRENDRSICLSLDNFVNYYTKDDGISYYPCSREISNCSNCYYDNNITNVKCTQCSSNFVFLIDEGICLAKNKLNKTYYYINVTHINICSNSIEMCDECENNHYCFKCKKDFYMINDNHETCLNKSLFPKDEYFINNENTIYYSCNNSNYQNVNNCKFCSSKTNCTLCKDNYTFIDGIKSICTRKEELKNKYIQDPFDETNFIKCEQIFKNCYSCNDTQCLSCKEGYIFIDDNYLKCELKQLSNTGIASPKNPFYQLFILQVRIIDKLLKIFFIISTTLKNFKRIKIPIELYKNNNNRNLQDSSYENLQVDFYINENNDNIESGKIYELTSQEEFSDSNRIVVKQQINSEYEMKVLNNDKKILDTQENEKMIQNGEIYDLSSNTQTNNYIIESASNGCTFNLFSKTFIEENKQDINLNFIEVNNKDSIINVECILSNEYNNKIPCSLNQNINKSVILDSYVGSNNKGIFYITQDSSKEDLILNCQVDINKKINSNSLSVAWIISIIIISIAFIGLIILSVYFCKRKKISKEDNNKPKITINSTENINSEQQINTTEIRKKE